MAAEGAGPDELRELAAFLESKERRQHIDAPLWAARLRLRAERLEREEQNVARAFDLLAQMGDELNVASRELRVTNAMLRAAQNELARLYSAEQISDELIEALVCIVAETKQADAAGKPLTVRFEYVPADTDEGAADVELSPDAASDLQLLLAQAARRERGG